MKLYFGDVFLANRKVFLGLAAVLGALLLFAPSAYADIIDTHDIVVDVDATGVSHYEATVSYINLTTDKVYYLVPGKISNLRAEDNEGTMFCSLSRTISGTEIACDPNVPPVSGGVRGNYTVKFSFEALDLVRTEDAQQIFVSEIGVTDQVNRVRFGLRLPEGVGLTVPATASYAPPGAVVGSTGRRVTLDWDFKSPELGRTFKFEARYEPLFGVPFSYDYLYGVLAGVVVLIVYLWRRSARATKKGGEAILSVLNENEKKVLESIIEKGSGVKQREIVRMTEFSKAKVSRILTSLERRGLVKKSPLGRTKKIFLVDKRLAQAGIRRKEKEGGTKGEERTKSESEEGPKS